jgi:RAB6A-GEF complex partner protein 1
MQTCLESNRLKTAGSYLLVLHNLEQLEEDHSDAVRLLKRAVEEKDWQLCKELLRFLHSIDDTGVALKTALEQSGLSMPVQEVEEQDGESPRTPSRSLATTVLQNGTLS